ncbi:hypothetical protein Tco_1419209 [Tanacetum coccineum]
MTTLAEHMIVAGVDNCPPMLEKSMYDCWQSHMLLYIQGKEHGRMIHDSVLNNPLVWSTIEVDGVTRTKTYEELSDKEKLQADCDLKATNIVLQGLPPDVYSLVNHHKVAKEIWDRVSLLMEGTKLTQQERECLVVPSFLPGDDLIACLNKSMSFMSTGNATSYRGTNAVGQAKEFNMVQGKDVANSGTGIWEDCDDISLEKAVLMANISSYDSDVLSEVPHHDTYQNDDMINQSVQEMQYYEQSLIDYVLDNDITSDSNIISYEQYLQDTQNLIFQDTNSFTQQDAMIMSVFEQMSTKVTKFTEATKKTQIVNESLTAELERYNE